MEVNRRIRIRAKYIHSLNKRISRMDNQRQIQFTSQFALHSKKFFLKIQSLQGSRIMQIYAAFSYCGNILFICLVERSQFIHFLFNIFFHSAFSRMSTKGRFHNYFRKALLGGGLGGHRLSDFDTLDIIRFTRSRIHQSRSSGFDEFL